MTTAFVGGWLVLVPWVMAHGVAPSPPSNPFELLLLWSFDPLVQVPLIGATVAYLAAVRTVNRAHPGNPVPRRRVAAFLGAMACLELALQSPIERYDTTLFSVHMVQHLLLTLAAAPLLAESAPVTLLLRRVTPAVRRRVVLPILHSRVLRALTFPLVGWLLFVVVMWTTHFSPIFNASLDDPLIHDLEHLAYLGSALLFWWPVVGADPAPWRLPFPARALYAFLQLPLNTFLGLAIYWAPGPLYAHYVTLQRTWGPSPLKDQQLAAALMMVSGDTVFIAAALLAMVGWMHEDEREAARFDAQLDAERARRERRASAP